VSAHFLAVGSILTSQSILKTAVQCTFFLGGVGWGEVEHIRMNPLTQRVACVKKWTNVVSALPANVISDHVLTLVSCLAM